MINTNNYLKNHRPPKQNHKQNLNTNIDRPSWAQQWWLIVGHLPIYSSVSQANANSQRFSEVSLNCKRCCEFVWKMRVHAVCCAVCYVRKFMKMVNFGCVYQLVIMIMKMQLCDVLSLKLKFYIDDMYRF